MSSDNKFKFEKTPRFEGKRQKAKDKRVRRRVAETEGKRLLLRSNNHI